MPKQKEIKQVPDRLWDIQRKTLAILQSVEENGGEIDPEQEEELLSLQAGEKDAVDTYQAVDMSLEGEIQMLEEKARKLREMAALAKKLRERLENYVMDYMKQNGITRMEGGGSSVTLRRNPPKVVADDEKALVQDWERAYGEMVRAFVPRWLKISVSIDKIAVKEMLKENTSLLPESIRLEEGYRLDVK